MRRQHQIILIAAVLYLGNSCQDEGDVAISRSSEMQMEYGLYAENRDWIEIEEAQVPKELRELIPYAVYWGIGDDIIRSDFIEKAGKEEKLAFAIALTGRTQEVTLWPDK
ncbi:MAG: hypothetical protein AAF525_02165 [Pseudomonadota bacterium]